MVVCHDDELVDVQVPQYETVRAECRPMSQLLSSASEVKVIFLCSPLFSKNDIDGLPPIAHGEGKSCGSKFFIDLCFPHMSSEGVGSARVHDIDDLLDDGASKIRNDVNKGLEDRKFL